VVGAGGDVTGFIDDITTRAADFASVFNIDVAEALQVFQSGLSGEAEPLKRFGINLLDTEVKAYALDAGLIAVGETMTEQQKVQARYGLLMESTAKTQGDFANTSDSLANSQRILQASFEDLQASVGSALLPVFADLTKEFGNMLPSIEAALVPAAEALAETFRTQVVPIIQEFTAWLASPEGTKQVTLFAEALVKAIADFIKFAGDVVKNFEEIKNTAVTLGAISVALGALRVVLQLVTAAQLLFNAAVLKNPYVIAATAIAALVGGLIALDVALLGAGDTQRKADEAAKGFTGRIAELVAEERRLQEQLGKGAIGTHQYREAVTKVRTELNTLQGQLMRTGREAKNLNDIRLGSLTGQLSAAAGEANRFRNILAGIPAAIAGTGTGGTGGTGGQSAAEKAREEAKKAREKQIEDAEKAFEQVQKLVRATQKKIVEAQQGYDQAVNKANADYLDTVAKLRTDYAAKLEGIIQSSQDRLRGAFASAATFGLAEAFEATNKSRKEASDAVNKAVAETVKAREKVAEAEKNFRQSSTDSQRTSAQEQIQETKDELAKIVEAENASREQLKELTAKSSAEVLVESLRNKLIASRNLINSAAALASEGFSQTFIEQIVSAGTETGNELAAAILNSTPETQAELKGLFTALEQTGETGMDGLAKTIFEQQGLATRELRDLYKKTGEDLDKALLDQQVKFQETLKAAAETLGEKLRDIKTDFEEDVADLKGAYGGLKPVIDGVTKSLDSMIGKADQAAKAASDAAIKAANSTRAAIADITGKTITGTDLGLGASGASEGLRGFGDPLEMRRLAAIQAAGEALGTFSQQFVNTVLGQRSFVNDGQRTVLSPGASEARVGELIAQGFKEEIAAGIGGDRMNLALALAEQIYGVDIGGISTPGAIGGNTFNISVNAGMGTDPISVGAQIVEAIKRYERSSGQVFAGV
jgi:hypothetical protein